MLCLGRKLDESFTIFTSDGPIVVTLVGFKTGGAKLGIDAPKHVKVWRNELLTDAPAEGGGA